MGFSFSLEFYYDKQKIKILNTHTPTMYNYVNNVIEMMGWVRVGGWKCLSYFVVQSCLFHSYLVSTEIMDKTDL